MALLLPLLALLIAIGLDFARVFQVVAVVANSSRVAAEYGGTHGLGSPQVSEVRNKALAELGPALAPSSTVKVYRQDGTEYGASDTFGTCEWFRVNVRLTFHPITPLASSFVPGGQLVTRDTWMRRNGPKGGGCP
jgi:hypothetical protein